MGRESSVMRDEFELSLELSIGGCYSKSENKNLVGEKGINDDVNLEVSRSDFSGGENGNDVGGGNVCEFADPLRRREIRALKRREARMKQSRGGLNNGGGLVEDKLIFEGGGEERETDESAAKREKIDAENLSLSVVRVSGAQFPSPVGKVFPSWSKVVVAGEMDGKSSGDEPENAAAQPSSSVVSHHWSTCTSQRGGSSSDSGSHSSSFGTHQNSSSQAVSIQQLQSKTSRTVMEGSTVRKRLHSNLTGNAEKPSPPPTSSAIPKLPSPSCLENGDSTPQMPRVSTTGNGPNGKTITGFLYKYMESEVRIMCACHGSFFSPAEFVEHAGGVNVTNPLRHITVDPRTVKR